MGDGRALLATSKSAVSLGSGPVAPAAANHRDLAYLRARLPQAPTPARRAAGTSPSALHAGESFEWQSCLPKFALQHCDA